MKTKIDSKNHGKGEAEGLEGIQKLGRRQLSALRGGGSTRGTCKAVGGTYHSFSDSDGNYYQTCNIDGKLAVWLNY